MKILCLEMVKFVETQEKAAFDVFSLFYQELNRCKTFK